MSEEDFERGYVSEDPERPECFGDGERVCPEDENGVMQPQANCLPCVHLRPCMQTVLHRRGKIRLVERPVSSKVTGFFKRWSNQKLAGSEKKSS
ncbi:MAG: hypothetical protein AB9866_20485 [Syntrophobacteraceae bacterium]